MFTICLQFAHTLFTTDRYNVYKDKGKGYSKRVSKVYSMKQYIELNHECFEVKKVKGELHPIEKMRSLEDCYEKPSQAKREIYNYWLKWYLTVSAKMSLDNLESGLRHFTIDSYNCMMFTLKMDVYEKGNFVGHLYVSKTRQEFWKVA